jgi:hypothetical protein
LQKNSKWLSDFKRAIIEKDFIKIGDMVNSIPKFETLEENKEALALVKEANYQAGVERKLILEEMQKVQKTKKFLEQKNDEYSFDMSF